MTVTNAIVAWAVSAMVAWSPPDRQHSIPEAMETEAEATLRYTEIANAVVNVTYDPANDPILLGKYGRAQTTILLLSLASNESGFRRDVDLGLGKEGHGDHGKSHCMMQILTGLNLNDTSVLTNIIGKSWGGKDLVEDREKCFYTGYRMAKSSFHLCRHLRLNERLALYASGSCNMGLDKSRARVDQAMKWYRFHVAPMPDEEVLTDRHKILQAALEKVVLYAVSNLVLVSVQTFEGAPYTFPDMERSIIEKVLDNEGMWRRLGSLALSNISGACLVLPLRIIKSISIDDEVKWKA